MGIPVFGWWMIRNFGESILKKLTQIPNLLESHHSKAFQNFYIDLNGLIHPCTHNNGEIEFSAADFNFNEAFWCEKLCKMIEKLVEIVKPSNLLYLAIDGVAPRSKMYQQRKRR